MDLTVDWYAQAVTSVLSRRGDADALARSTRCWHASEQRLVRETFEVWQAGDPAGKRLARTL